MAAREADAAHPTPRLLCKPSVQLVCALYVPCCEFAGAMESVLDLSMDPGAVHLLPKFLDQYVQAHFLPALRSDLERRMVDATDDSHAFVAASTVTQQRVGATYPLLESAPRAREMTFEVFAMALDMPRYAPVLVALVSDVLQQYLDACEREYLGTVHGHGGWGADGSRHAAAAPLEPSAFCGIWVRDERVRTILRRYPLWASALRPSPSVSAQTSVSSDAAPAMEDVAQQEYEVEMKLLDRREVRRENVMVDVQRMKRLACMHQSLAWLALEVDQCLRQICTDAGRLRRRLMLHFSSEFRFSSEAPSQMNQLSESLDGDSCVGYVHHHLSERATVVARRGSWALTRSPARPRRRLSDVCRKLCEFSDTCLMTLHLDIRCETMRQLVPMIQQTNFVCDHDVAKPDAAVVQLNRLLSMIDADLFRVMESEKHGFLFEGLAHLMAALFLDNVQHIRRINEHGVQKICRDLFALEQCIVNIAVGRTAALDRARRYFELLRLDPSAILDGVTQDAHDFSLQQYVQLLALKRRSAAAATDAGASAGAEDDAVAEDYCRLARLFSTKRLP